MNKNFIAWDIENIGFKEYSKIVNTTELDNSFKFFVHNSSHPPIKQSDRNFLTNRDWEYFLVKEGKDSADNFIIDKIKNNINQYSSFTLITGDQGFSNIVVFLIEEGKKVTLVCNDKSDKLINKIYSKTNISFIEKNLQIRPI